MRTYRRTRKDNPQGVIGIYDNEGKTIDRYTVVYTPYTVGREIIFPYVDMSAAPFHPQGVCQHGETIGYRITGGWGTNLKVIAFTDLPPDCQEVIKRDLS